MKVLLINLLLATFAWAALRQPAARIVGGQEANAGQWPWAAAIHLTTANGNYFCGGTILDNLWILTAGQCVNGATLFTIVLGSTRLNETGSETIRIATDIYRLHPDYDPETLDNDVGLIRFRQQISFTLYTNRAYLPYSDTGGGVTGTALGWGQLSDSHAGLNNHLHWVYLTTIDSELCKVTYGEQITDSMICAIGNFNEGTCIGDTGGPLTLHASRGYHVILGVASFLSAEGCESPHPSGYTKIWSFNDWIKDVTGEEPQPEG